MLLAPNKFLHGANFPNGTEHVDVCDLLPLSVTLLLFMVVLRRQDMVDARSCRYS